MGRQSIVLSVIDCPLLSPRSLGVRRGASLAASMGLIPEQLPAREVGLGCLLGWQLRGVGKSQSTAHSIERLQLGLRLQEVLRKARDP